MDHAEPIDTAVPQLIQYVLGACQPPVSLVPDNAAQRPALCPPVVPKPVTAYDPAIPRSPVPIPPFHRC